MNSEKNNPVFKSGKELLQKLKSYIDSCNDNGNGNKKLPNVAGFCCFCSISRTDYHELKNSYPLHFDIAESTFIDEILNTRLLNPSAIMTFLKNDLANIDNPIADNGNPINIICEHNGYLDGE